MIYSKLIFLSFTWLLLSPVANANPRLQAQSTPTAAEELDLDPEIIENSPVLQRWLEDVPNVLEEIRTEPSFPTRLRFGYSEIDDEAGITVGVEDVFLGKTGLTVSGEYNSSFENRTAWGANLRYYVLPLGNYFNIAPVVGYRNLEVNDYSTDGLEVGLLLKLALSPGGAADLSLSQTFVSPTGEDEAGITTLSVGYAVTDDFRLSTDIQRQNTRESHDNRFAIVLEWMPN